jgi:hypothetical protein
MRARNANRKYRQEQRMAVVGGLLLFIGLAGMVVGVWAVAKGNLAWANIASRKIAAGVLAGGFVIAGVGSGLSGEDHDKVAVQAGSSEPTSTTPTSEAATSSTEATTTTAAAPTTSDSAPITTTTRVVTTTTRPPASTSTTRSTATTRPTTPTTRPTTTTTAKPVTTTTTKPVTTTTTPVATGGQVSFSSMQCDAPGSDSASNVSEEWVEIVNTGGALDLSGWSVHDEGPNYTYSFPSGLTLPAGGRVRIHTGSGANTATDVYWGRSQHVWNNTGDSASLVNAGGVVAASRSC